MGKHEDCRICKEYTGPNPCEHETPLISGYGFSKVSGWKGLGENFRCQKCYMTLWFEDDTECNTPEEIAFNEEKRKKHAKWAPGYKADEKESAE